MPVSVGSSEHVQIETAALRPFRPALTVCGQVGTERWTRRAIYHASQGIQLGS